ncbi:hypothetical protein [Nocardioides phosphati]|nr:hypothetical protein [Nocardioides phosphati]
MTESDETLSQTRAAAEAVRELCRRTTALPAMTPATVADALANLAELAAALPQASAQLGRILEQAAQEQNLAMDGMTEETDPRMAIDVARYQLEEVRDVGVDLHKRLDIAFNAVSHIISDGTE